MTIKESDEFSIDYEFLGKYIRDDSNKDKQSSNGNFSFKNFESQKQNGEIEVFDSVGEGESFSSPNINNNQNSFNKKPWQKNKGFEELDESDESSEKIESKSNISDAKKEFMEHLEDESLTVDTANKLNFDWKRK